MKADTRAAHRAARGTQRLVERNAERLRPDVPYRDVDAGNAFHDDAAAPAIISLGDAALERRPTARAVVHLFVDALGEPGIADTLTIFMGRSHRCAPPAAPICSQQRAPRGWLIGPLEGRTHCRIAINFGSSSARPVLAKAWATAPQICGLKKSYETGSTPAPISACSV